MTDIREILKEAVSLCASDIFIVSGTAVSYKVFGNVMAKDNETVMPGDAETLIGDILKLAEIETPADEISREMDFSFSMAGVGRFRVNVYRQRSTLAAVLRNVLFDLPDSSKLNIPESIMELSETNNGIILLTGAAGSGKSTTLTCMIDRINSTRPGHIVTIEDPIEFLHKHKKSIISQREIGIDTDSYADALRAALRQSPNVILLGEMRDFETISAAITAAETGVLLFSTLHTSSAANTINRIVDVFPAAQQVQIRGQLAQLIRGVVCQQLVPTTDGTITPVFEVLKSNPAIQNMIRENKLHQLESAMQAAKAEGMMTMDNSLFELYQKGIITKETLLNTCNNYEFVSKRI